MIQIVNNMSNRQYTKKGCTHIVHPFCYCVLIQYEINSRFPPPIEPLTSMTNTGEIDFGLPTGGQLSVIFDLIIPSSLTYTSLILGLIGFPSLS